MDQVRLGHATAGRHRFTNSEVQADPESAGSAASRSGLARVVLLVALVGAIGTIVALHGLLPGLSANAPVTYLITGSIQCLDAAGWSALTDYCHAMGEPLGYPVVNGLTVSYLGAALMLLPGLGPYAAGLAAQILLDVVALGAGYVLLRRLGARPLIALTGSWLYLVSPTALGLVGFPGTLTGFVLLPVFVLADIMLLQQLEARRRGALGLLVVSIGYAVVRAFALFTDGYGFVASALITGVLLLAWMARRGPSAARKCTALAVVAIANGSAYLLYGAYIPGGAVYDRAPAAQFRAMGLDLMTALYPSDSIWYASLLGVDRDYSRLWGDVTNAEFNYLGWLIVGVALLVFVLMRGRRWVHPLAAAAMIAFVLSLGGSAKWHAEQPNPTWPVPLSSYLMPAEDALLSLPTAWVHQNVPGIDLMRASYRWIAVTRFVIILLAALAIDDLLRRTAGRQRAAVILVGLLAVAEVLPNAPDTMRTNREQYLDVAAFRSDVLTDLMAATEPGERVAFVQGGNNYLVNYLAPLAGIRSYNVGVDKNNALSQTAWPDEIKALFAARDPAEDAARAFRADLVDSLIVPYFSLRWDSYAWPPERSLRSSTERRLAPLFQDDRFDVRRYAWFSVVTPRSS